MRVSFAAKTSYPSSAVGKKFDQMVMFWCDGL